MAELLQPFLQCDALGARELPVIRKPGSADAIAPLRAVGNLRCGEGKHIGIVVALDHLEVLADEECGTRRAAREEQDRLAFIWESRAVGALHSERRPFGIARAAALVIEVARQVN